MAVTSKKGRARPKQRTGSKMKAKKTVQRRSAAAAALATPLYRKRVVQNARAYTRKGKPRPREEDAEDV
jgi:stalled ribosome alternative rescue factor ArfA